MALLGKADAVLICVPTPLGQHFEPGILSHTHSLSTRSLESEFFLKKELSYVEHQRLELRGGVREVYWKGSTPRTTTSSKIHYLPRHHA
jgi:hypothetical protein